MGSVGLMRRSGSRRLLLAASAVVLSIGIAACGSDDKSSAVDTAPTTTTTTAPAGDGTTVVAKGFAFTDLTVQPGEQFTLDNQDGTTHTLTADDGSFDSGRVAGGTSSAPLTAPGTAGDFAFHCEIHKSMTGTLTVAA
jgi:plastocyanin